MMMITLIFFITSGLGEPETGILIQKDRWNMYFFFKLNPVMEGLRSSSWGISE